MRTFILGVVITLIVVAAIVYIVGHFGLIDMRADQQASRFETSFAGRAMDASTERHAPNVKNPIEPTDTNLHEGMKVYVTYCSQCHGDPATPVSALGKAEYPRHRSSLVILLICRKTRASTLLNTASA